MTDEELTESMHGLYTYDIGCTDSGIKDEILRSKVIEEIQKDLAGHQLFSKRMARIAREMWLSDKAIESGYGLEDMRKFVDWLDDRMRQENK